MKLIVSYQELSTLVFKKTETRLEFSFAGYNTLNVSMKFDVLAFSPSFSFNVTFNNVESNHVYLSFHKFVMGFSRFMDSIFPSILEKIQIVTLHDNQFDVDLNRIQKLKPMLEIMDLTGISFLNEHVELSFELRSESV